jgi:NAD(P)-dependent dehydrogenase (short-subunit alcohol dehydrogenase family)
MGNHRHKNALIFGGASGIGLATAQVLSEQGVRVTIADIKQPIDPIHGLCRWTECDVRDPHQIDDAVQKSTEHAPLDWLVYSAGIQRYGSVVDTSIEEYDLVQQINARGAFLASRSAIPKMCNGGAIVLVSSVQALACQLGVAAYAASKGTLEALTRAMAVDHAKDNIRVNAVLPGTVDTPMVRTSAEMFRGNGSSERVLEQWGDSYPIARIAHPCEVASVISFLLSDEASFITGASYRVDGGLMAQLPVRL